jgi:hypothetical protein
MGNVPNNIEEILAASPAPDVPLPPRRPPDLKTFQAGTPKQPAVKPDVKGCEKKYGRGHPMCNAP